MCMPRSPQIFDRVAEIVSEVACIDQTKLRPETNLLTDLSVDSLDSVEIVQRLEDEFKVEIRDQDAEKLKTIGDIVEHINQITGEK